MTLKAHDKIEKNTKVQICICTSWHNVLRQKVENGLEGIISQHIKGDKPSHDVPKFVVVVVVTLYIFILFSRFTGQTSTKLATKHTCRERDLYLFKWRTPPFYKGR